MEMWVEIVNKDGKVLKIPRNTFETFFKGNGFEIVEKNKTNKTNKNKNINIKEIIKDDGNEELIGNPENEDGKQNKQ